MSNSNELTANAKMTDDGFGVTLEAMFKGMQGVLQTKTVVGDPIDMGDIKLIPLVEVSTGMAGGRFAETARSRGAAAMAAKMSPVALLMVQGDRVRLINVKNQDPATRLIDLIPEAVDKITGLRINGKDVEKAEQIAEKMSSAYVRETSKEKEEQK